MVNKAYENIFSIANSFHQIKVCKSEMKVIVVLASILLTIFFVYFTFAYMEYFDVGVNSGTREMDVFIIRTPAVILAQVSAVFFFDKFASRQKNQWRVLLNILALVFAVCAMFIIFAMLYQGIPREGGFIRFLAHYFLGFESGQLPDGSW